MVTEWAWNTTQMSGEVRGPEGYVVRASKERCFGGKVSSAKCRQDIK